jgi:hypothetical protein
MITIPGKQPPFFSNISLTLNFSRWIDALPACVYAYRITKHESMQLTPFEVMYGRVPHECSPLVLENPDSLNTIPDKEVIAQRVRERQDIVIKKMKRRWDTVNTIVCIHLQI